MNRLPVSKQVQIVNCLVEGVSVRATCRLTGAAKGTVLKLLAEVGTACKLYQDMMLKNLPCKVIQCDEIWSFCYCKQKNLPEGLRDTWGLGDVWTWTAICADTKVAVAYHIGRRDASAAHAMMTKVASRVAGRVQLTSDGWGDYPAAVDAAFGCDVDYGMLIKRYGPEPGHASEVRYSPAVCIGAKPTVVFGNPDKKKISTSYVERQNLSMRMGMRRFTRLTNAFSKKVENLEHAVALYFMHYNFCRIHQTLRVTPAMEAGIANRVWDLEDIIGLVNDVREAQAA
jgi:IS1 family transposase